MTRTDDNVGINNGHKDDPRGDVRSSRVKRDTGDVDPLYYEVWPELYVVDNLDDSDSRGGPEGGRGRRGVDDNRAYGERDHAEPGFDPESPETGRWTSDEYTNPQADGLRPWPPLLKNPERVDLLSLHPCSGKSVNMTGLTVNIGIIIVLLLSRHGPLWALYLCYMVKYIFFYILMINRQASINLYFYFLQLQQCACTVYPVDQSILFQELHPVGMSRRPCLS